MRRRSANSWHNFNLKNELHIVLRDEELAKLAARGDRDAFEVLYDRYFTKLCWYAAGILNDAQRSQDVVQEIFLGFITTPQRFDSDRTFSTWIYASTKNRCLNVIRDENNRARIRMELARSGETPELIHHAGDLRILQGQVDRAVKSLKERDKVIFRMRFEQDSSIRQIAVAVNAPEGTVKSAIFHMLKKISKHLKEFTHER